MEIIEMLEKIWLNKEKIKIIVNNIELVDKNKLIKYVETYINIIETENSEIGLIKNWLETKIINYKSNNEKILSEDEADDLLCRLY